MDIGDRLQENNPYPCCCCRLVHSYTSAVPGMIDQLEKYTTWNFSIDYVSDPSFWQQQVLQQENGTYLYLKKL